MKYVGARYMPKFLGTYDVTQVYEALSVVDNGMGTTYVSNQPVPAGTPLTNTDYWAVYGASSAAIIQLQNDVAALKHVILNPRDFGAACDRNIDDSAAIQDMFDFALTNGITKVSFDGINEISFKNAEIKSDVDIDFSTCKFYGVAGTDLRIYNMFTVDDPDIDISIKGGEFIGRGGNSPSTNASIETNAPLIDISNAHSVKISGGYFHNINNTNEGVDASTPMANRYGALFRIHDTNFTSITDNIIDKCYGSELIFIIDVTYDREDIDAEFKNNVVSDTTTTALDFIGNNIEVTGNKYVYDYNGSAVNCMGLNVYVHDEVIDGIFNNAYDNCESTSFQGDNVIIENVIIKEVTYFARMSAHNVRVSNISIKQLGNHSTVIGHLEVGYGTSPTVHKDIATSEISGVTYTIENCDMRDLDGDAFFFLYGRPAMTEPPLINIKNCISSKVSTNTRYAALVVANGCDVKVSDCIIYTRYVNGFSGTTSCGLFIQNDAVMNSLTVKGCDYINPFNTAGHDCIFIAAGSSAFNVPVISMGIIADSTLAAAAHLAAMTNVVEAALIGLS